MRPCPLPRHIIHVIYKYTLIMFFFPLPALEGTARFRGSVILHLCVCVVQMRKENPPVEQRCHATDHPIFCFEPL